MAMPGPLRSSTINTFPDGSVGNPGCKWAAYAGMGVWLPGRDLEVAPLGDDEFQFSLHEQTPDGVMKWAALRGRAQDSTRAELAALLMALTSPGTTHIGQDNDTAVGALLKILRELHDVREKPLGLVPNGDIIEALRGIVSCKGSKPVGGDQA